MKIRHLKVSAVLLAATLLTSSCVGSFSLFNKLAGWNKDATGNKFLNELIFILISPAYAVCTVADVLVLNTVTTLRNGYKIKSPDGEVIKFKYDKKTNSWSKEEKGKIEELFRINEDGTIQAHLQDGRSITVTPDAAGLYEVRMAAAGACFWAQR